LTANTTGFSVAGGTTSKTLQINNNLTFSGTDGASLNIGAGGSLGTAAYTASTAYQPADADLTAIAGLAGTSGFLKKTATDTWALDTSTYLTGNQSITLSGDATGSGATSIAVTLANSGVTAGTYPKVTVDAKGRVTSGASLASTDLPTYTGSLTSSQVTTALGFTPYSNANPNGYITGNQSISISGDASGTGSTSIALTLANSGATAGTYRSVTVDAKGRVTAGTNPTTLAGYGITDAQALDADLTAIAGLVGTSGFLKKTAADTWSLDTSTYITGISSSDVTTALGYTPYNSTNPSGYITGITSGMVTTALGYTPYNSTNPSGYITGISSSDVTTALGYTPYNSTNPNGYITSSGSISGNAATATTATTATTANGLATGNSYQVASLGVGTAASGTTGEIRATNNITAYYSSDRRLKENIRDIPNAIDAVDSIGGKLFDWTDSYVESRGGADGYFVRKSDFGVVAQDVQSAFPLAVREREDGTLAVDYEKLCALAFAAIKELSARVKELEAR